MSSTDKSTFSDIRMNTLNNEEDMLKDPCEYHPNKKVNLIYLSGFNNKNYIVNRVNIH